MMYSLPTCLPACLPHQYLAWRNIGIINGTETKQNIKDMILETKVS
jgi:hypothetical protein